ncbi:unnamed protein product [Mytilus edulis]|uniref:Tc1-like transposase DDE domain-containing protein n=1 Tax=Mytilus edulis TaxID=6550 RepID=A0A8S3TQG1_MYTED|nr:unnamed protein product [Mytilus edulis]
MNKEHFTEWFRNTLLPKLPPRSVIIMDNAPYHSHLDSDSRVPDTSSNKSEISAWLEKSIVQGWRRGMTLKMTMTYEDTVSDTINDADEILCNTCGSIDPPKPIQKDKYISWFQCDACDQWVHNRCCTKPALAKNVCLRCFSIFNHRNLSEPLNSPLEEMKL